MRGLKLCHHYQKDNSTGLSGTNSLRKLSRRKRLVFLIAPLAVVLSLLTLILPTKNVSATSITSVDNLSVHRALLYGQGTTLRFGSQSLPYTFERTGSSVTYYALDRMEFTIPVTSNSGMYYSGSLTVGIYASPAGYMSNLSCNGVDMVARPGDSSNVETLTYTVSDCYVSNGGLYVTTTFSGRLSSPSSVTALYVNVSNTSNYLLYCNSGVGSMAYPCSSNGAVGLGNSNYDFSVSTDPTEAALGNISVTQQQQNQLIEQQINQDKEQYEAEKSEEAQREQAGQDSAAQLGGIFNFNIPNPFTGMFVLFTESNSCVQVPIIAGMLGSDDTQYCPWFSGQVREILTPVIGISASMLLFGFVIRGFLNKGNFSGGIEV